MKERPILFSTPMVRALLAGTKTQTRRLVKPQPTHFLGGPGTTDDQGRQTESTPMRDGNGMSIEIRCPYGQPGDRLWVRETFVQGWPHNDNGVPDQFDGDGNERPPTTWYRATSPELEWCTDGERDEKTPWRPSIHMPRAVSRITLDVVGVRVERLQGISDLDAIAEGIGLNPSAAGIPMTTPTDLTMPRAMYRDLWESINGAGSWAANPWVWVVEFKQVTP